MILDNVSNKRLEEMKIKVLMEAVFNREAELQGWAEKMDTIVSNWKFGIEKVLESTTVSDMLADVGKSECTRELENMLSFMKDVIEELETSIKGRS